MHHLYIVVLTRFHAFSSKEILYLYSKIHITKYRVKLVVFVILKKHFLCMKGGVMYKWLLHFSS